MNKSELLAPAGSFEIGKTALYSGCDAIYLALDAFGARAYAKNFTIDELKEILKIAHALDKKVYVTVNTVIKNGELEAVYNFLDEIYLLGVDAVICADIAVFMYVINNCNGMGCHISTQVGVKDLNDVLFFENIKADRVVLAREDSFEEIKHIKENSNIELEVFIHGALCVSYSGGCLFSSLLSLRSGNRGRCSQNCRREYTIYENDKPITKPGFYLSMKDLCVGENVKELVRLGISSLKIEGRMKNLSYVNVITNYYRNLIDNKNANFDKVNQIFHRQFTKGFIFNEDRKNIATITDASSQGKLIGNVVRQFKDKLYIKTTSTIRKNERIRFFINEESTYFTVSKLFNLNNIECDECIGECYLECNLDIKANSQIYKMSDNEVSNVTLNSNLIPLNIFINAQLGEKLTLTTAIDDNYISIQSNSALQKATKNSLTEEVLYQQLNKLGDTPFYIDEISAYIEDGLFISLSEINELRRKLVAAIYDLKSNKRNTISRIPLYLKRRNINLQPEFIAKVSTIEQYNACKSMGLNTVFYNNFVPYVKAKYNEIEETEVLVANYGGLHHYTNKIITTDYAFNVMNKDSLLHLLNFGAQNVTLSYEMSFNEIKELSTDFYQSYGTKAPIDMIIYGRQKLMTMKYCPLKKLGLCGNCRKNNYYLVDKFGKFFLETNKDCIVSVYNNLPLNLIEELSKLSLYVNRFRFEFTTESYDEVIEVIKNAKIAIGDNTHKYKNKNETKGYFKRSIM